MKLTVTTSRSETGLTSTSTGALPALHDHLGRLLAWPFSVGDAEQVRPIFHYLADVHGSGNWHHMEQRFSEISDNLRKATPGNPAGDACRILVGWPGAEDEKFVECVRAALWLRPSVARRWVEDVEETAWSIYTTSAESAPR